MQVIENIENFSKLIGQNKFKKIKIFLFWQIDVVKTNDFLRKFLLKRYLKNQDKKGKTLKGGVNIELFVQMKLNLLNFI